MFGGVLLVLISAGCHKPVVKAEPEPINLKWLVDKTMLDDHKLQMDWQIELPVRDNEKLSKLMIIENRIYAFTDSNYLFSVNRNNGNIVFSQPFALRGFPIYGFEKYGDKIYSVVGNRLVEIDINTGIRQTELSLGYGITCPASRNGAYYYVAGSDNRIHILNAKNKVEVLEVAAYDYSKINSVIATNNYVVFGTDSGRVASMAPVKPERFWDFDAADAIIGPMVKNGGNLFFASKDTKVYNLNISSGRFMWKYQTGAVLDAAPVVTEKMVYQYVDGKGLAAIDRETGKLVWQEASAMGLLAEIEDDAFVLTSDEKILVMDNAKAQQKKKLSVPGVTAFVSNTKDSKIYIADKQGRLSCIEPTERY